MHTSIVDAGFLFNCISWMSFCGFTWIALAVAVSVLVPVVLPYCNTPWQNDSSSDNVHVYSHMLAATMNLALFILCSSTAETTSFSSSSLLFCLAGLFAGQPLLLAPAELFPNSVSVLPPSFYIWWWYYPILLTSPLLFQFLLESMVWSQRFFWAHCFEQNLYILIN